MDSGEAVAGSVLESAPTAVTRQQLVQTEEREAEDHTRRVHPGHSVDPSDSDTSRSIGFDSHNGMLSSTSPRQGSGLEAGTKVTESNKRKLGTSTSSVVDAWKSAKRAKRDKTAPGVTASLDACQGDLSLLPAGIWHRIFTLVHPTTLGKLLRVNTVFKSYLDPSSSPGCASPRRAGCASSLPPDSIWQASRRRFCPRMPAPMRDRTELDMWKLAYPGSCQFCGKPNQRPGVSGVQDESCPGPGLGARTVWPFALRSCGPCLLSHSTKDMDVYTPSMLQGGQMPRDVTKIFLTKYVHELVDEFRSVESMGSATVEEWLKGLEARGKELRTSWEKWELAGVHAAAKNVRREDLVSGISNGGADFTGSLSATPSTGPSRAASVSQSHMSGNESSLRPQSQPSRARTLDEVKEMKAARRAEIERRAMLLEPPLLPPVLAKIPSFQAAIQITMPFDDHAWNLLKPRLLAQRGGTGQHDKQGKAAADTKDVRGRISERRNSSGTTRESKEVRDRAWDDAQANLRTHISAYADEIVKNSWDDGSKVNKGNGPSFAADTLLYVRKRFYAEVAKDIAAARAAGREPDHDQPDGPFTQKLTLENMKWLFETKIKPHVTSRELFLCNGCEGASKSYGFEGVVQHYAAKHANGKLSRGSIVVYWRSEWPAVPPFHPDPRSKGSKPTAPKTHTRPKNHESQPSYTGPSVYGAVSSVDQRLSMMPGIQEHVTQPLLAYASSYPLQSPAYNYTYSQDSWPCPGAANMMIQYYEHPGGHIADRPGSLPPSGPCNQHVAAHQGDAQSVYAERIRLQLRELAYNSREIWTAISGLKDLPGNARIYVVIHHAVKRYRSRFSESPPLAMFIDGLSNEKDMRPVRNVNNLVCKSCYLHAGSENAVSEARTFSLPQLVNHFQQHHIEPFQAMNDPFPDWAVDMVLVSDLTSLARLRGTNDHQHALIMEAFPDISMPDVQSHRNTSASDVYSGDYTHDEMSFNGGIVRTRSRQSPDARPDSAKKARSRMAGLKNKRTAPSQRKSQRKDGAKAGGTGPSSRVTSIGSKGDNEGDVEELRQEQAIRAMWAAERRDAARAVAAGPTYPRDLPLQAPGSPSAAMEGAGRVGKLPVPALVLDSRVASLDIVGNMSQTQAAQAEDDLFAGLESHLDQYRIRSPCDPGAIPCERVAAMPQSGYEQPIYDGRPAFVDRPRAQPIRPLPRPRASVSIQHRQQSPLFPEDLGRYPEAARTVNPMYHGSSATLEPEGYVPIGWGGDTGFTAEQERSRAPALVYGADTYVENPRSRVAQATGWPVETYDLLRVRDAEGEYYIRRRIDRPYAPMYEEELPVRGERGPLLGLYPPEPLRRAPGGYADPSAHGYVPARPMRGPVPDPEYTTYDEYDPRFPAASLGGGEPRHVRYD